MRLVLRLLVTVLMLILVLRLAVGLEVAILAQLGLRMPLVVGQELRLAILELMLMLRLMMVAVLG